MGVSRVLNHHLGICISVRTEDLTGLDDPALGVVGVAGGTFREGDAGQTANAVAEHSPCLVIGPGVGLVGLAGLAEGGSGQAVQG